MKESYLSSSLQCVRAKGNFVREFRGLFFLEGLTVSGLGTKTEADCSIWKPAIHTDDSSLLLPLDITNPGYPSADAHLHPRSSSQRVSELFCSLKNILSTCFFLEL